MGYSVVPTVASGDLWTAANHNMYIRDNFAAGVPAVFSAAGDLPYAPAALQTGRIPIGELGEVLKVLNSGIPGWGGPKITRMGQSGSDWGLDGSTVYTPDKILIQMGAFHINDIASQSSKSGYFLFSPAFAGTPLVFTTLRQSQFEVLNLITNVSSSQLSFLASNSTGSTHSIVVNWLAIGSPATT